jgi:hypothetical protein
MVFILTFTAFTNFTNFYQSLQIFTNFMIINSEFHHFTAISF